jgi:hypothetical protein
LTIDVSIRVGASGFSFGTGIRDNGEEELPPRTSNHVNVPVITKSASNMTPAVLLHGANVFRRFRRREVVHAEDMPGPEGVR